MNYFSQIFWSGKFRFLVKFRIDRPFPNIHHSFLFISTVCLQKSFLKKFSYGKSWLAGEVLIVQTPKCCHNSAPGATNEIFERSTGEFNMSWPREFSPWNNNFFFSEKSLMKSVGKDKLLLVGFILIIFIEFSVHYHDEKTIKSLRLKKGFLNFKNLSNKIKRN